MHHQMPMVAKSVALGGNVRVGMEDNLYLERGVLPNNGQQRVKPDSVRHS